MIAAPVLPTAAATQVLRPLGCGDVSLTSGIWHEAERRNRERSLPHAHGMLEQWGNLLNLRMAAAGGGPYTGLEGISDSDVYKVLEAEYWSSARPQPHRSTPLGAGTRLPPGVDVWVALIEAAQQPDGYLNSWHQLTGHPPFEDLVSGYELYCSGHLLQAAVAERRSGAGDRLLMVATKHADLLCSRFGQEREAVPTHPGLEMALVELYRLSGQHRYLDLAVRMIELRGKGLVAGYRFGPSHCLDHVALREMPRLEGHAVMATYLGAGATDVAVERNDHELLGHLEDLWSSLVDERMYVTGGLGSRHFDESLGAPYELPSDRAYSETCASVGAVMWAWRLLLATGRAEYAAYIERAVYNVLLGAVGEDGRDFFYANALQARRRSPGIVERYPPNTREPWFACACCPPNLMRTIAQLGSMLVTTDADGAQVHQYAGANISVSASGQGWALRMVSETTLPWEGDCSFRIVGPSSRPLALSFRVPDWAGTVAMWVNGRQTGVEEVRPGYVTVRRQWCEGDEISLSFQVAPVTLIPHPEVDGLRGCVAVAHGPVVYCVESQDVPGGSLDGLAVRRPVELGTPTGSRGAILVRSGAQRKWSDGGPGRGWPGPYESKPALEVTAHEPSDFFAEGSPVNFTMLPYFARANRGPSELRVWLPIENRPVA